MKLHCVALSIDDGPRIASFIRLDLPDVVEARDLLQPQDGTLLAVGGGMDSLAALTWPRTLTLYSYVRDGDMDYLRWTAPRVMLRDTTEDSADILLTALPIGSPVLTWEPMSILVLTP